MALSATQKRQVGLELKENITAFKTNVDAINTVVAAWTLDGADGALPTDADTKAQLLAYEALSKPVLSLDDALAEVRAFLTLSSVEGLWSHVLGNLNYQVKYIDPYITFHNDVNVVYGNQAENQVRWGLPRNPEQYPSGLGFTGTAAGTAFQFGEIFEIGQLRHFNYTIATVTAPTTTDLKLNFALGTTLPITLSFDLTMTVNETPNTPGPVDDIIGFSNVSQAVIYAGYKYTFELLGFGSTPDDLSVQFISPEGGPQSTLLFGKIHVEQIFT